MKHIFLFILLFISIFSIAQNRAIHQFPRITFVDSMMLIPAGNRTNGVMSAIDKYKFLDSNDYKRIRRNIAPFDYNELINKPDIPSGTGLNDGNYVDVSVFGSGSTILINDQRVTNNKLSLMPPNTIKANLSNSTAIATDANKSAIVNWLNYHAVATSGSYIDLNNKPTIPLQFNPIAGSLVSLSGTYPNITFSVSSDNTKQNVINLTTTGSTGAATLVGSTLNIPQYNLGSGSSQTLDQTLNFGNTTDTNLVFNGIYTNPVLSGNINSDNFMITRFQAKNTLGFGIGFHLADINGDSNFPDRVWAIGTNMANGSANRLDTSRAAWTISMEDLYLGNSEFHIVNTTPTGRQTRVISFNPSHTLLHQNNTYISANPFSLVTMSDANTPYITANYSYDSVAYSANSYGSFFQVVDPSSGKNIVLRVIKNSSDAGNKGEIVIGNKNMLTHYDYGGSNKFLQFGENNPVYTNWFPGGMLSLGYNSEAILWAGIGTLKIGDPTKTSTMLKIYSGEDIGYGQGVYLTHKNQLTSKEIIQGDIGDTFYIKNFTDTVDLLKIDITNSSVRIGNKVNYQSSAILNVSSTTKGLLPPRMTKTQRDAISSPAIGLVIYQTDNTPGLRCYNGTNWMRYTETVD